ncbi:MAG: MotA/TolQ/ExbB proton channel family protein [Deltaproteobacteria bacterium]|nr:MotA/TolQ/ExbB proton channel family protein [Deltaproteobacteria bacterium]
MNLTQKFLAFTLLGAEWVLWLLIGLSVVSVAIMIDRWRFLSSRKVSFDELARDLKDFLAKRDADGAEKKYGAQALAVAVGIAGIREAHRGAEAAAEAMLGAKTRKRQELERNLAFLGTLGNNAPFIGLFGTVLGIIKAFHDLSENSQQATQAVMAGISEALVATAVGLLVALPAVMTYNFFNRRIRRIVGDGDAIFRIILTELRGNDQEKKREAA